MEPIIMMIIFKILSVSIQVDLYSPYHHMLFFPSDELGPRAVTCPIEYTPFILTSMVNWLLEDQNFHKI